MSEVYNFGAGPAVVPRAVLERARDEMLDFAGSGCSVMELSHRGPLFTAVAERAEASLRALLGVPDDYAVLFCQGGARTQFAAVPLNLGTRAPHANYVDTGYWSTVAITEARRFADVHVAAKSRGALPDVLDARPSAAYLHFTPNETIDGVEFPDLDLFAGADAPLVADASSNILSGPLDVSRFGVIYAGAQKNVGIAGLTLVIVRRDLLGAAQGGTPAMLDWSELERSGSMLNTPPTFAWYFAGLVFDWLLEQGGLEAIAAHNAAKARHLYGAIDASNFYASPVAASARSNMNVPFTLADAGLDKAFLDGAEANGLKFLKGHRAVGGMRASLYNAMPLRGVEALVEFMREFERTRG